MINAKPYQPPPVDRDEMRFAVALFAAAATGRIVPPGGSSQQVRIGRSAPLLSAAKAVLQGEPDRLPNEVSLICAVSVLWHHYEQDSRQQAVCSRLVAFHALIAKRQGLPANSALAEPNAYLAEAVLSPAIVQAVAAATVSEDGLFEEAEFDALVESYSTQENPNKPLLFRQPANQHKAPQLSLTEDVRYLSLQLFAFQSCIAEDPASATRHFRTLEQLCARVVDLSGTATLHAMLSRVWRATLPDFPWLKSTPPPGSKLASGLASVWQAPDPREAMKCEMALLGFMIELLRALLGDAVTVQLLRSLWPLADLDLGRRLLPRFKAVRIFDVSGPATRPQ